MSGQLKKGVLVSGVFLALIMGLVGIITSPAGISYAATVVEKRIAAGGDDAEENLANGNMYITSSDIEMIYDAGSSINQLIGLRFTNVNVPAGAQIASAYLQFAVDEISTGTATLAIQAEAADNAAAFSSTAYNVSQRKRTAAAVDWSPPEWPTVGEAGVNQRTPNIAAVIQEVVGRAGWNSGNALVIIISGINGSRRCAESYEGSSTQAALLHIEYNGGTAVSTSTHTRTNTPAASVTRTNTPAASATKTNTAAATPSRTSTTTATPSRTNTPAVPTATPTSLAGGYNIYYGHLHNHSNVSDGVGSPSQAYAYARDTARMDFFSLADHSNSISATEWTDIKNAANTYNQDGVFVALWGFEWSSSSLYGHVTVVNTEDYCSHTSSATDTFTELVSWLEARNGLAFFNHPGREDAAGQEFLHFTSPPSPKFVGMELWNKNDAFNVYYYNDGYFAGDGNRSYFDEANGRGWQIGAAGSSDNHTGTWGTDNDYRLAVLATAKTRTALLEALAARRFYSTLDKNLALTFTINGMPMGSTIAPGSYTAIIEATDGNGEIFTKIEIFKNGALAYTFTPNSTTPKVTQPLNTVGGDYYYVKVTQSDGNEAISSPIYVK